MVKIAKHHGSLIMKLIKLRGPLMMNIEQTNKNAKQKKRTMKQQALQNKHDANKGNISWQNYTFTVMGVFFAFSMATFAMGVYFSHLPGSQLPVSILLVALYLLVIFLCIRRLVQKLPLPALMLLVPIAPLAILLLVISLLPIVQMLR